MAKINSGINMYWCEKQKEEKRRRFVAGGFSTMNPLKTLTRILEKDKGAQVIERFNKCNKR